MRRYEVIKSIRMDDATLSIMKRNMEKEQMISNKKKISEATYIRDLIHRDYMDKIGIDRGEFIKALRVLSGMGNNINQIAHRVNMDIYTGYDVKQLEDFMQQLNEIKSDLALIRNKL
jgi:hypothetical protein